MTNNQKLNNFLREAIKAIGDVGTEEYWPLNPSQLVAYFDIDILLDFYDRLKELKKRGENVEQIVAKSARSSVLIDFLFNYATIGFKILHNLKIKEVSFKERINFFNQILNLINYRQKEMEHFSKRHFDLSPETFIRLDADTGRIVNRFKTALFTLNWAYFYDNFAYYGFSQAKPEPIRLNNKKCLMILDEYYNIKPIAIWPLAKLSRVKHVEIFSVYEPFKYTENIYGRIRTKENIGKKLIAVKIFINGREEDDLKKINKLTDFTFKLSQKQAGYVEKLTDLKKVEKAILMSYWIHRDFFGPSWHNKFNKAKMNIKTFGNKFLNEYHDIKLVEISRKDKLKKWDPRNNYY
jgi:hypothetical protein